MVPDAARISASVSDGPEPFLPAISRPGRMARPMTARRGVVGAHRTVAAANALTAPTAPVPLIRRVARQQIGLLEAVAHGWFVDQRLGQARRRDHPLRVARIGQEPLRNRGRHFGITRPQRHGTA